MSGPASFPTDQCVIDLSAAPADGGPLLPVLMDEARRRGFTRFVLAGGGETPVGRARQGEEAVLVPDLVGALPHLAETAVLLDASRWFDFNWLDLPVALPADAPAVAAVPYGASHFGPWGGGAALVRREAVAVAQAQDGAGLLGALARSGELVLRAYDAPLLDLAAADPAEAPALVAARRRRPAAFLDRDGVLNLDRGYVHRLDDFTWIEGAKAAVKRFNDLGWYVFVVTNQSGIGRGYYVEEDVWTLHRHIQAELRAAGAHLDDWRYCPFHPDGTIARYRQAHPWRKPEPGMLLDLMDHWPVVRERSLLIGDKDTDMAAARAAGVAGHLFTGGDLAAFVNDLGAVAAAG